MYEREMTPPQIEDGAIQLLLDDDYWEWLMSQAPVDRPAKKITNTENDYAER